MEKWFLWAQGEEFDLCMKTTRNKIDFKSGMFFRAAFFDGKIRWKRKRSIAQKESKTFPAFDTGSFFLEKSIR